VQSGLSGRLIGIRPAEPRTELRAPMTRASSRRFYDVVICGGGVMGMSTATHLAARCAASNSQLSVAVVEKDNSYASCSAMLSAGGIRQQFSLDANVRMSLYGLDYLRAMSGAGGGDDYDDVQLKEQGYLFLASSQEGVDTLRQNHTVQTAAGAAGVHVLETDELARNFPWLNTEDILLASSSRSGEGWFDPWALLQNLKRAAVATHPGTLDFIEVCWPCCLP
jgi:FAD-dependent oxidoreductase domain-containing protein 1